MPEPVTPADDRCLAGLAAALAGLPAAPLDRTLAGFADAVAADAAFLLEPLEPATARVAAGRERRPPPDPFALPAVLLSALADGRVVRGGPELASRLTRAADPSGSLLLAALPAPAGPPTAAVALLVHLTGWTWTNGQEHALRGLAAGLAGWHAARALQLVLDHLPQRIAWKDPNLRYRGANRAFLRATGLHSVVGRSDAELDPRPESGECEASRRREREALAAGAAQLQRLETVPLPGGRELWFCASRVPLEGGGLVVARDDITAAVALAEQLALAHRTAVIGRLAAAVDCDLRPLAARISADVAAARSDPAALDRIDHAAHAADDLARQLAAFARRQLSAPADIVPLQLLTRMEPTLDRLLGERIELRLSPAGLRCMVRVDPRLFEQLLVLLVRHVRELLGGRGRLDVDIAPDSVRDVDAPPLALAPGEYVRLRLVAVPGLPRQGDAAFEADPPRGDPEHGLRLALVRAIAAQAAGAVHTAVEGELVRIELRLPRVFAAPGAADDARPVSDLRGAETLLLVEDDPAMRPLIAAVLRHLGYAVHLAADVDEAAARLAETGPSGQVQRIRVALALVSAALPGPPGDALRRLRAAQPDLRVLWIAPAAVAPAALAADGPLVVPCSFEALAVRVRQALDARA